MDEHNKDSKSFEELLKNMETRKTADLDDFEREALEGFALLESNDEAKEVKANLDEKIYSKLFNEDERKKRPVAYWFAAAGLLLVIGLSVLFVTNSENITGKKDVAQTIPLEEKSTPANPTLPVNENLSASENLSPTEKTINPSKDLKQGSGAFYKNTANEAPAEEIETKATDDFSKTKGDFSDNISRAEDANSPKPVITDTKEKEKEETINLKDEEKVSSQSYTENNFAGSVYREEKKQESASFKLKKNSGKKAAPSSPEMPSMPSSISGNTKSVNTSPAPETEGKSLNREDSDKSKLGEKENNTTGEDYCYYTGGKSALREDLKKKFTEMGVNKAFKATLYINEKKKVEKINFTDARELTSKEKKKISVVLKELSGFNFFIQPTQKGLHEFELIYIP